MGPTSPKGDARPALSVVYALVPGRWAAEDVFSAPAARMIAFNEAPLAKVIFTTFLYVSPVQIIPACDHTGTPLHFHSSTTSGSACLMRLRTRASVSPRQSLSSLILASISSDGDSPPFPSFADLLGVLLGATVSLAVIGPSF